MKCALPPTGRRGVQRTNLDGVFARRRRPFPALLSHRSWSLLGGPLHRWTPRLPVGGSAHFISRYGQNHYALHCRRPILVRAVSPSLDAFLSYFFGSARNPRLGTLTFWPGISRISFHPPDRSSDRLCHLAGSLRRLLSLLGRSCKRG